MTNERATDVVLNKQQKAALNAILAFVKGKQDCFVLQGSAGTGKTTMLAELIQCLDDRHKAYYLLAPTGRAARILGAKTHSRASTIHSVLYDLDKVKVYEEAVSKNDPGIRFYFPLREDDPADILFIIDEASMVGDKHTHEDYLRFGSGRLLADLVTYARLGRAGREDDKIHAKLLFIGDPAQLPPVGESMSPALSVAHMEQEYGLRCAHAELTDVMRQAAGSRILQSATVLRDAIMDKHFNTFDIEADGVEIVSMAPSLAIDLVVGNLVNKGINSSVLVTRSNARALALNQSVRGRLWESETADLHKGDILQIVKNSSPLMNGDLVKVVEKDDAIETRHIPIKGVSQPVSIIFRRVSIVYRDADGTVTKHPKMIIENLLDSPERALTPVEQRALLVDFRMRYPGLKPGSQEFKLQITTDPWFNALQVKYGYAMTCHKAQGGEWDTTVVDFAGQGGQANEDFFRWSYTAITRAKSTLITLSAPNFTEYSSMDWGNMPVEDVVATEDNQPVSDWDRFSFSASQKMLYKYHEALSKAWGEAGIQVTHLQHLQYCERYTLEKADEIAYVQYWYKASQQVSRIAQAPGMVGDGELSQEGQMIMEKVLLNAGNNQGETEFVRRFREQVGAILKNTDIHLVSSSSRDYCLRLGFDMDEEHYKVDFFYDSSPKWTSVTFVNESEKHKPFKAHLHKALGKLM